MRILSYLRSAGLFLGALTISLSACTEPRRVASDPKPATAMEARLSLSDSTAAPGRSVVATVSLAGSTFATATVRVSYDTTGLAFTGADSLDDGAMRALNPTAGLVRIAVMSPSGIANGKVHALRFTVLRTAALRSLKVSIDEAHTVGGADVASQVKAP